jgi:HAE1 family hydrophobic/amphiphilic exporter-1
MWVFNFTLNTMTLLALSLAIGLLIDDAIVVRENIVRHVQMGKDHVRAAKEGTSEIGLAVMSTSFAVIAVFIPVAFMGGMIGKIFFQFFFNAFSHFDFHLEFFIFYLKPFSRYS